MNKTYKVVLEVTVPEEETQGIKVDRETVELAVLSALEAYQSDMGECLASSGDWNHDCELVGAVMEYKVK